MAKIRADLKNYKRAFKKHLHSYSNWNTGSDITRRMVLCYCIECGLKCLVMQNNRISRISQANDEIEKVLGSHDFRVLLKAVNQVSNFKFKTFKSEYGDTVTPNEFHQICRYCIETRNGEITYINEFEETLQEVKEWLLEVI